MSPLVLISLLFILITIICGVYFSSSSSVYLSLSGTFFHVDQALLPADLSFCSWSTIKQVSIRVVCTATSPSPFITALHYGLFVTVPQGKLTVCYLLPSSLEFNILSLPCSFFLFVLFSPSTLPSCTPLCPCV